MKNDAVNNEEKIVVLDFGSQYAHLIAKRFRMLGFYSVIALPQVQADNKVFSGAKGIVLSGGPAGIYEEGAPAFNEGILSLGLPVLGLCYGHYVINKAYGGIVQKARTGEFGYAMLKINEDARCPLFEGIDGTQQVWMSHNDAVIKPGAGFSVAGSTKDCDFAALQNLEKRLFTLQFHCEVKDTPCGNKIFENFASYCGMRKNRDSKTVLDKIISEIRLSAGEKNVLLFLSGGVDSTVAFALLNKALGQSRVLGLHIDNGFMRQNESEKVAAAYKKFGFENFAVKDASSAFLRAVDCLTDPQQKRAAVGETFIKARDEFVAEQKQNIDESNLLLAQGTLYPDIIESGGSKNADTIKTHHNRVEGIKKLLEQGLIIEPLKDLYKDEVRLAGKALGLPDELIMRHPFPGPGLSINVLCSNGTLSQAEKEELTSAKTELDAFRAERKSKEGKTSFAELILPVKSVGVQGDLRTYRFPAVLRFGKADKSGFFPLPERWDEAAEETSELTNGAKFINRCVVQLWQNPSVSDAEMKLTEAYCRKERLDLLRQADEIVLQELHSSGRYDKIFQHLTIELPFSASKDRCSFVLRPVCSEDVMTATFARLPFDLVRTITQKIAALPAADAVYYDTTNKPPATFGWE